MMTPAEIRLRQNQILTGLMLGAAQGNFIAETLFPRLPQALSSVSMIKMGNERLRRYNLRRAPGAPPSAWTSSGKARPTPSTSTRWSAHSPRAAA
jgi:hypothetical protein